MAKQPERDPRPVSELLNALVGRRGWAERMAVGTLRSSWVDAVGPLVAEHSVPVALNGGVLTVRAEGGAWAAELTLLAPALATKVDDFLGPDVHVGTVRISSASSGLPGGGRKGW